MKASLGGFLHPFLIILNPVLLLQINEPMQSAIQKLIARSVFLIALEILVIGQYLRSLKILEFVPFLVYAGVLIGYFVTQSPILLIPGLFLFAALTVEQKFKDRVLAEGY